MKVTFDPFNPNPNRAPALSPKLLSIGTRLLAAIVPTANHRARACRGPAINREELLAEALFSNPFSHQPPTQINIFESKMESTGKALKEALVSAQSEERLTIGVYESAMIMNDDPDSVSFCVLAVDEDFECDIALQIHFTLIQSFCFDNEISIVRVSSMQRLAQIVGDEAGQFKDAHCLLITVRPPPPPPPTCIPHTHTVFSRTST
uniref:Growth arrest and DNA damage-inducible protein GADD45 gamma-like n=1 Tax=Gadus morhua TaxID=8049 RepID=A0A8C5C647_GADMO